MNSEKSLTYTVVFEAAEEGGYVVSVPMLPGCFSQGETLEEAEAHIREAIEAYLESMRKNDEEIPVETKVFHGSVNVPA